MGLAVQFFARTFSIHPHDHSVRKFIVHSPSNDWLHPVSRRQNLKFKLNCERRPSSVTNGSTLLHANWPITLVLNVTGTGSDTEWSPYLSLLLEIIMQNDNLLESHEKCNFQRASLFVGWSNGSVPQARRERRKRTWPRILDILIAQNLHFTPTLV